MMLLAGKVGKILSGEILRKTPKSLLRGTDFDVFCTILSRQVEGDLEDEILEEEDGMYGEEGEGEGCEKIRF